MALFFDSEPDQPSYRKPLGIADLNANLVNAYTITAADSLNLKLVVSPHTVQDMHPIDSA